MTQSKSRQRNNGFWQRGGWGVPMAGILVILLALAGISASQAEPNADTEEACADGDCNHRRHGRWGHHRRGHRFFGDRGHDPERAREHMQYATGWMLERLDVEEDVQGQIQARLGTAFEELVPLAEAHRDTRHVWLEAALGADGVDREQLEALRTGTMASADRVTEIVTNALADVAEMLTPEQRVEIAERIERHHH